MPLFGWTLDIAREQSSDAAQLSRLIERSSRAGFGALGLYLEHRFAYPSAPWAAPRGALTGAVVAELLPEARRSGVRLIPFLNTLGHMEGFIRASGGEWLAEGPATNVLSLQMCATRPECREFARGLVADAMEVFDDDWVHLGGDETRQLGQCPACTARVAEAGAGGLYGEYYGALCRWVMQRGRRPCLWADVLLAHADALAAIPRETLLFDWQYDRSPRESTARLRAAGFDVVCCPALHTFDSAWCDLRTTRENVDAHAEAARELGARGVFLTTWEMCYGADYESVWPLIFAAGRRLAAGSAWDRAIVLEGGDDYARAAERLGVDVPAAATFLAPGTWRQLRDRLVLRQDPFRLWRDWRGEACGAVGDMILRICDDAAGDLPPGHALRGPIELHRAAVEWVRCAEAASTAYAARDPRRCEQALRAGIAALQRIAGWWERTAARGGSAADPQRLRRIVSKIEAMIERVPGALELHGARPAFETLAHDGWIPSDAAAWRTGLS